jgi:hypothetical protein
MKRRQRHAGPVTAAILAVALLPAGRCPADVFHYVDADGQPVALEASLVGSSSTAYVLATPDGQYHLVPRAAAHKRVAKEGPAPLDGSEMAARLEGQFGAERFRSYLQEPFVIGLVLESPLPRTAEGQAKALLRNVASFLKNVEAAFGRYLRDARIQAPDPSHPVVVLIFEARDDFEQYAAQATGRDSADTTRIAGFYSKLTNILALRLEECRTFETPLHEAIHQQLYARGIFQRLAPIPTWFDEGIATGFEANAGKINVGPGKISVRYANQALQATRVNWQNLLTGDDAFREPDAVDDAYGLAWGLHWLLVTRYKNEYAAYMRTLGQKTVLGQDDAAQRSSDFQQAFGDRLAEMQQQFQPVLEAGLRNQRVALQQPKPKGISLTEQAMGEVQMTAVRHQTVGAAGVVASRLEVQGRLNNLSPLRPLAFHVTVETGEGTYAEWFVPSLASQSTTNLPAQNVTKPMAILPGAQPGGAAADTFRVRIRSTPADSEQAELWKSGQLPVPVVGE